MRNNSTTNAGKSLRVMYEVWVMVKMAQDHTTSQPWNLKGMLNAHCEQYIWAMFEADLMRTMSKIAVRSPWCFGRQRQLHKYWTTQCPVEIWPTHHGTSERWWLCCKTDWNPSYDGLNGSSIVWRCLLIFDQSLGDVYIVIIDCFEVFCQRPCNLKARAQAWSNYKHHNTVKSLIGIVLQGVTSFILEA